MGYQRAQWHSGLTYQRTCETCKTVLQYTDYSLDFRPWYADGFVDCPKCKSHLRHNESFAIGRKEPEPQVVPAPEQPAQQESVYTQPAEETPACAADLAEQKSPAEAKPVFCTCCGNRYGENDRFCAQCGSKR